jgi:type IV pilus assembly protein PilN
MTAAIRINLLPHRQQRRALQQRLFVALLGGAAVLAALVVLGGHIVIAGAKERQVQRNDYLRQQIAVLDKQIKEIQQLKEKTADLLARKDVVESLQTNRAVSVHLFDELARRLPDGMYLEHLKQDGQVLTLQGYAQSSARVSTLMRNLEASPWFEAPTLIEVSAAQVDKMRVSKFTLTVRQAQTTSPEPKRGAHKT